MTYEHLLGRTYVPGRTDCFALARDFFNPLLQAQSLPEIPNLARPTDFATENVDLFARHLHQVGFQVLHVSPIEWRFGDVALIALFSKVASHCGILVDKGQILHHCLGQVSTVEPFGQRWRQRMVGVLRHRDLDLRQAETVVDISTYLPASVQEKLRAD